MLQIVVLDDNDYILDYKNYDTLNIVARDYIEESLIKYNKRAKKVVITRFPGSLKESEK